MEGIGGDTIEAGLESQTNKFVTIDNIVFFVSTYVPKFIIKDVDNSNYNKYSKTNYRFKKQKTQSKFIRSLQYLIGL